MRPKTLWIITTVMTGVWGFFCGLIIDHPIWTMIVAVVGSLVVVLAMLPFGLIPYWYIPSQRRVSRERGETIQGVGRDLDNALVEHQHRECTPGYHTCAISGQGNLWRITDDDGSVVITNDIGITIDNLEWGATVEPISRQKEDSR